MKLLCSTQKEGVCMEPERIIVKGKEFIIETTNTRGRYSRVVISDNRIRMKIPSYLRRGEAEKMYNDFKEWAIKKLERMDHSKLESKPRFLDFRDGQELLLMGKKFLVKINQPQRKTSRARITDNILSIDLASNLADEQRQEHVYALSRRLLSRTLLPDLRSHVDSINSMHFGFQLNGLGLREQMTRWGSCSRKSRSINLNFRLLFAPNEILDYVIVHELAHLKEPNHSSRFWNLVGTAVPEYKSRRKWLNEYGRKLGVV